MPGLSQRPFTHSFGLKQVVLLVTMIAFAISGPASLAQAYTILHTFTGGVDGGDPYSGLTIDQTGNLYGTAAYGGRGFGVVYELARKNSGWIFHPLCNFAGGTNGEGPLARVVFGTNGTLYGTTYAGGNVACGEGYGCGTDSMSGHLRRSAARHLVRGLRPFSIDSTATTTEPTRCSAI